MSWRGGQGIWSEVHMLVRKKKMELSRGGFIEILTYESNQAN